LSVEALRKWSDVRDLIDGGTLKQSTFDRALVKVGSYDSGELSLEQFMLLTDMIQRDIDATKLSESYEKKVAKQEREDGVASLGFQTSQQPQVLRVPTSASDKDSTDDEEDDEDELFEAGDELSEEEATREVFNELKEEGSETLSLVSFIRWDDVQELLGSGALSKDDLAAAIEKTGVTVESGSLTFENVSIHTFFSFFLSHNMLTFYFCNYYCL
jgi:hypothetical protein